MDDAAIAFQLASGDSDHEQAAIIYKNSKGDYQFTMPGPFEGSLNTSEIYTGDLVVGDTTVAYVYTGCLDNISNNTNVPLYYMNDKVLRTRYKSYREFVGGDVADLDGVLDEWLGNVYAIAESTASSTFYNYMTRDKQEANALYIYYKLSKEGWEKEAIAGLLGNLQHESVMNPGAWQNMGSSGNGNENQGYGLVQWTTAKDKFLKDAGLSNIQANNLATSDPKALMDMQIEYLLTTMKPGGGEWIAGEAYVKDHYNACPLDSSTPRLMSYSDYISSNIDAGELALVFQAHYERSGDYKVEQIEHRLQQRYDYAQDWYIFLKNY